MRNPGQAPQFDRLMNDLRRAQEAWCLGEIDKAERILRVVASVAYAESKERGPNDPVPEVNPYSDGEAT